MVKEPYILNSHPWCKIKTTRSCSLPNTATAKMLTMTCRIKFKSENTRIGKINKIIKVLEYRRILKISSHTARCLENQSELIPSCHKSYWRISKRFRTKDSSPGKSLRDKAIDRKTRTWRLRVQLGAFPTSFKRREWKSIRQEPVLVVLQGLVLWELRILVSRVLEAASPTDSKGER